MCVLCHKCCPLFAIETIEKSNTLWWGAYNDFFLRNFLKWLSESASEEDKNLI
jgi:formate hydrogenlyase subunit 6/NADH:ubiquinone oxidoreductase subunit I